MANNVAAAIRRIARQRHVSPKELKAAYETGIVESGLKNLPGGDRDSAGWRQERASIYKDPTNLDASINRFFNETGAVKHKYATAGELAAAVQRPAAQYRGRYQQVSGRAQKLLQGGGGGGSSSAPAARGGVKVTGGITPATEVASREEAVATVLSQGSKAGLQDFRKSRLAEANKLYQLGLAKSRKGPTENLQVTQDAPAADGPADASKAGKIIARVNVLDKANNKGQLPYKWGGGHAGRYDPLTQGAKPVDCSGLVSAATGMNPRVASQFKSWGKPGAGGTITVYAKDTHVLAKVKGRDGKWHFFGTSAANPGGGAGWIPASKISSSYLKGFTVRHN